jgi:hypothetical protein
VVMLQTCILEVLNSNLGQDTDYRDQCCSWFSSVPPGNTWIVGQLRHDQFLQNLEVLNVRMIVKSSIDTTRKKLRAEKSNASISNYY